MDWVGYNKQYSKERSVRCIEAEGISWIKKLWTDWTSQGYPGRLQHADSGIIRMNTGKAKLDEILLGKKAY